MPDPTVISLADEVTEWLQRNGYEKASFHRLMTKVASLPTIRQLSEMVETNPSRFRSITIAGGVPGLALKHQVQSVGMAQQPMIPPLDSFAEEMRAPSVPPTNAPFPKVTQADVDAEIVSETYTLLPNGRTTVCQLTLKNGFTVEGYSACVCIENYNEAIGNNFSKADAVKKLWPLLGFRLADKLSTPQPEVAPPAVSVNAGLYAPYRNSVYR